MNEKKQKIIDILNISVLVSSKSKQKILDKLDSLFEGQLDVLLSILINTKENQEKLIKKVFEIHPDFLEFLEKYAHKEINKSRIESEKKSFKKDEEEIINLEEVLGTLI